MQGSVPLVWLSASPLRHPLFSPSPSSSSPSSSSSSSSSSSPPRLLTAMASACLNGCRGGKGIKLFGAWVESPMVRENSGHEEENREESTGKEQPRQTEHRKEEGDRLQGEVGDQHVEANKRHGQTQANQGANSTTTPAFLHCQESRNRDKGRYWCNRWTEEEHKGFVKGLAAKGKGNWKDISREFVKTRTPTQVATHAQKYFLRHHKVHRRGPSIFDLVVPIEHGSAEEEEASERRGDERGALVRSHSLPSSSALFPQPPPPAETAQQQPQHVPPPPPPSQPTPLAVTSSPPCSDGWLGLRVAPTLHFTFHPGGLETPFLPRNVVLARQVVTKLSHSYSDPELYQRFSFLPYLGQDEDDSDTGRGGVISQLVAI